MFAAAILVRSEIQNSRGNFMCIAAQHSLKAAGIIQLGASFT